MLILALEVLEAGDANVSLARVTTPREAGGGGEQGLYNWRPCLFTFFGYSSGRGNRRKWLCKVWDECVRPEKRIFQNPSLFYLFVYFHFVFSVFVFFAKERFILLMVLFIYIRVCLYISSLNSFLNE